MKCHRHTERDAVAACKHCLKGICEECMVDAGGSAACSERCAEQVISAQELLLRAAPMQQNLPRFLALFLAVIGMGFAAWGLFQDKPILRQFVTGMGLVFLVFSIVVYRMLRRREGES